MLMRHYSFFFSAFFLFFLDSSNIILNSAYWISPSPFSSTESSSSLMFIVISNSFFIISSNTFLSINASFPGPPPHATNASNVSCSSCMHLLFFKFSYSLRNSSSAEYQNTYQWINSLRELLNYSIFLVFF